MWMNKIIYLLVTIYAAVLAVLYLEVQALYVFITLLLLPLFFLAQVLLVRRKLYVVLTSKSKLAVEGLDKIEMRLLVGNASYLPATCVKIKLIYKNLFAEEEESKQVFTLNVGPKSERCIDFSMKSTHTGLVKVKVTQIKVYDFIRLFSRKSKSKPELEISVLPEIYSVGCNISIREPDFVESDIFSKNKPGDDPSEVFDIREYKEGDRIHRIHWKLSSKKDAIMIKDYSLPIANLATVLINTSVPKEISNKLDYMDALMETTASICYHLVTNNYCHTVAWYEQHEENYVSTTLEDLDSMYYMLGDLLKVTPVQEENRILDAHQVYGETQRAAKVFYITYELNEEIIGMLLDAYAQAQVEVMLIGEESPEDESSNLGRKLHKQYISINNRRASIEVLQL